MKAIISKSKKQFIALFALLFTGIISFAQDGGLDVDVEIGDEGGAWYNNPLYWVIGALLFIVLIAVIVRSGKNK